MSLGLGPVLCVWFSRRQELVGALFCLGWGHPPPPRGFFYVALTVFELSVVQAGFPSTGLKGKGQHCWLVGAFLRTLAFYYPSVVLEQWLLLIYSHSSSACLLVWFLLVAFVIVLSSWIVFAKAVAVALPSQ